MFYSATLNTGISFNSVNDSSEIIYTVSQKNVPHCNCPYL